jgi:hypothetical protein
MVDDFRNKSAVYTIARNNGMSHEQALEAEAESVFGVGYKRDKNGKPIETGIGSAAQPTPQHRAALAKSEGRQQ